MDTEHSFYLPLPSTYPKNLELFFFFFYSRSCEEEVEAGETVVPRPIWVPVSGKDVAAKGLGGGGGLRGD